MQKEDEISSAVLQRGYKESWLECDGITETKELDLSLTLRNELWSQQAFLQHQQACVLLPFVIYCF